MRINQSNKPTAHLFILLWWFESTAPSVCSTETVLFVLYVFFFRLVSPNQSIVWPNTETNRIRIKTCKGKSTNMHWTCTHVDNKTPYNCYLWIDICMDVFRFLSFVRSFFKPDELKFNSIEYFAVGWILLVNSNVRLFEYVLLFHRMRYFFIQIWW